MDLSSLFLLVRFVLLYVLYMLIFFFLFFLASPASLDFLVSHSSYAFTLFESVEEYVSADCHDRKDAPLL